MCKKHRGTYINILCINIFSCNCVLIYFLWSVHRTSITLYWTRVDYFAFQHVNWHAREYKMLMTTLPLRCRRLLRSAAGFTFRCQLVAVGCSKLGMTTVRVTFDVAKETWDLECLSAWIYTKIHLSIQYYFKNVVGNQCSAVNDDSRI